MKIQDIYNLILENKVGTFSGAGIIFFDGINILLLKKSKGYWVFPGGKPIQGETPLQTAKRETKEEIGKVTGELKEELTFSIDDRTFHSFIFLVDKPFKVELSKEHTDYTWLNFKKVKDMKLHKNVYKSINKVIKSLKKIEVEN